MLGSTAKTNHQTVFLRRLMGSLSPKGFCPATAFDSVTRASSGARASLVSWSQILENLSFNITLRSRTAPKPDNSPWLVWRGRAERLGSCGRSGSGSDTLSANDSVQSATS